MTQYQLDAPSWNRKILFILHLYLAERCCENLQRARGLARCKFGPAITWLVDVTIYCTVFQKQFNISPPTSPVFTHKILFFKISHGKCWLNESLNFNWGGVGPLANMYSYHWLFSWQNKISKENLRVDYYLLLKCCQRQCTLLPPTWTKSHTIKIKLQNAKC